MPAQFLTYEQIAADLADRIARGEYPPGSKLPSNRALADLYSVSTGTVERAHIVLRERGLTFGVIGRGVFVTEREDRDS